MTTSSVTSTPSGGGGAEALMSVSGSVAVRADAGAASRRVASREASGRRRGRIKEREVERPIHRDERSPPRSPCGVDGLRASHVTL
jgi:hypothetical protein